MDGLAGLAMAVGHPRRNRHRDPIPVVTVGPENEKAKQKLISKIMKFVNNR